MPRWTDDTGLQPESHPACTEYLTGQGGVPRSSVTLETCCAGAARAELPSVCRAAGLRDRAAGTDPSGGHTVGV